MPEESSNPSLVIHEQEMDFWPEECPPQCLAQLEKFFGDADITIATIQEGMSRGNVYLIEGQTSYILKLQAHSRENDFYRQLGMKFGELSLGLPQVFLNDHEGEMHWLLLERVPHLLIELLPEGWDEECVRYLHQVHSIDPTVLRFELGTPLWRDKDTGRAVELLGGGAELDFTLKELQKDSQHLFEPVGLITGDSALPNWARRADQTLVKFDWRTIGRGHPALDLGILIGLCPTLEECEKMARQYAGEVNAADIRRASVWNVVSFLSGSKRGIVNPPEEIFDELKQVFLPWVLGYR